MGYFEIVIEGGIDSTKTKISCLYQNKGWVVIFNPTQS